MVEPKFSIGANGFKLYSESGEPSEQNRIARCKIFSKNDEYICSGVVAPIQRNIKNFDINNYFCLDIPFNSTQINVISLKNEEEEQSIFISTNQNINAYNAKFTSPIFSNNYKNETKTLGHLFETLISTFLDEKFKITFDDYKKSLTDYGSIDVWWICEQSRTLFPFREKNIIKYAYTIHSSGKIMYKLDFFEQQDMNNLFQKINSNIPTSLLAFQQADGHVNTLTPYKIVNDAYEDLMNALNNDPNFIRRIVLLLRFVYSKQSEIDEYHNSIDLKKEGLFRIQNITPQLAEYYLKVLIRYNPTFAFLTLFLFERFYLRVEDNFYNKVLKNNKLTNWAPNLIYVLKKKKENKKYLNRFDIEDAVLKSLTPTKICEFLIKEINDIETIYTNNKNFNRQYLAKKMMFDYGCMDVYKNMFNFQEHEQWFKDDSEHYKTVILNNTIFLTFLNAVQ